MEHQVFTVPNDTSGQLSIMPCPPAGKLLETISDLKQLQKVTCVLSMLALEEMPLLGVADEAMLCATNDIRFFSYPIEDFGLPDLGAFQELIADLVALLRAGEHIAVHCRAGIGRSGMVAACVLTALGQSAQDAIRTVSEVRGVSIPDTVEQGRFIASYAKAANLG